MSNLMKKKLLVFLSVGTLLAAQPAVAAANYAQIGSKVGKIALWGVVGGFVHKGSNWLCEKVLFHQIKDGKHDKYDKKMDDVAGDTDRIIPSVVSAHLELNNTLHSTAFSSGFDAYRAGKTLWNAQSSIFDTKKWNVKAAGIAALYSACGLLNVYADKLIEKNLGKKWAALSDLLGRGVRHGILWRIFEGNKHFHRSECEAVSDLSNLGTKLHTAW